MKSPRRRFGRRRSDRLVLVVAILAVLGLFWTYTQGCSTGGESPTAPARTSSSASTAQPTASSTPAPQPVADPTPDPNAAQPVEGSDWKGFVNFDEQGNLQIFNPLTENYDGEYCYFINGPHPQTLLWQGPADVASGQTKMFPVPDLASMIDWIGMSKQSEEPVCEIEVQSDVGRQSFDCDRPSNQLADAGTDHLHNYKYFTVNRPIPTEWIEGEWVLDQEGKWSECQYPEVEASTNVPVECTRTRTDIYKKTFTKLCSEEVKEETEERVVTEKCECPCVWRTYTEYSYYIRNMEQRDNVWYAFGNLLDPWAQVALDAGDEFRTDFVSHAPPQTVTYRKGFLNWETYTYEQCDGRERQSINSCHTNFSCSMRTRRVCE